MKRQKSVKNVYLNFPDSDVTSSNCSFVQTAAQNTNTPHFFINNRKVANAHISEAKPANFFYFILFY